VLQTKSIPSEDVYYVKPGKPLCSNMPIEEEV